MRRKLHNPNNCCLHCRKNLAAYSRGLCYECYHTPEIRERYPSKGRGGCGQRGLAIGKKFSEEGASFPLPEEPTQTQPGSYERILIYQKRLAAGEQLFHPDDNRLKIEQTPEPYSIPAVKVHGLNVEEILEN